jgi:predicted AlkP superfamily pyrophosphatase or phosphodiesterase
MDWDGPGFHHSKENAANTPFMDEFIMDGALKILENERPKLLFVGLVSPNIVAHAFTTESIELGVSAAVVDRLLGMVLFRLKEMGWFDDTLIILTADHGMADKPFCIDLIGALRREGRKDLVENIAHLYKVPAVGGLYLHQLSDSLIQETTQALREIEHVKGAWYKGDPKAPWFIRRGAHERAPDIIVIPEFRYQIVPEGRTEPVYPAYHGAPYFADLSIAMIFSGCGIKRMGTIGENNIPSDELLSDEVVQELPEQIQIVPTIKRILRLGQ